MMFAVAERNSGWDENLRPFNCDLTLGYTSKSNGARSGNMESDQLSQMQTHLALTVWMLPFEVVSCLDEDDCVLLEPMIASYLVRILFP